MKTAKKYYFVDISAIEDKVLERLLDAGLVNQDTDEIYLTEKQIDEYEVSYLDVDWNDFVTRKGEET